MEWGEWVGNGQLAVTEVSDYGMYRRMSEGGGPTQSALVEPLSTVFE